MKLHGEDASVFGDQPLDFAALAGAQQVETLRHGEDVVGVVLTDVQVGQSGLADRLQEGELLQQLRRYLHLFDVLAGVLLLHFDLEVDSHQLMAVADPQNLQTGGSMISFEQSPRSLFDPRIAIVD